MFDEVIEKILNTISEKKIPSEAYPKFSGEGYKAAKIDAENFHQINPATSSEKIAFVDGGNAEIISSANFSLNLIRVCYIIYQNNKKISMKKFEIFAFVQAVNENNDISYKATFFKTKNKIDFEEISFSSFDRSLMFGINRAEIGSVANAIRRFAELKLARLISDEKIADVILLDGNLQSTITNEYEFFSELFKSCTENNIILAALSKTTSLFTDDGNLLSVALGNISQLETWFYNPIAEISNKNHHAEIYFAKFHEKSRHIFSFEIFNKQKQRGEETINILAGNCSDPIFIGYPYGLVEADKHARVSKMEKEALKTMFLVKLKNKSVEKYMNSKNAHEILDRISF